MLFDTPSDSEMQKYFHPDKFISLGIQCEHVMSEREVNTDRTRFS